MGKIKKGEAAREEILDAAETVFSEKGYQSSSVGDILKFLGISSGAVYHHFPTKKSILENIVKRLVLRLKNDMETWIQDPSQSPGEKVERFLAKVESGRQLRLSVERLGMGLVREDRDMHELLVQMSLEMLTAQLTTLIEQGNECGEFHTAHPRAAAVTIILLLSEFIHRSGRVAKIVPREEMALVLKGTIQKILSPGKSQ